MNIFLTGGTGALGARVVRLLVSEGHAVTATARRSDAEAALADAGAHPVRCDLFDAAAVGRAVEGHEAVLHLATAMVLDVVDGRIAAVGMIRNPEKLRSLGLAAHDRGRYA